MPALEVQGTRYLGPQGYAGSGGIGYAGAWDLRAVGTTVPKGLGPAGRLGVRTAIGT